MVPRRVRISVLAGIVAVTAALVMATPAGARRVATASEHAAIAAAVRKWDQHDQQSGLAQHWAVMHRCSTEQVYVSTVDSHWAALSYRSKYFTGANPGSDPRYRKCQRDGATVDGVWIARQTTSGGWVGTGWVYGDLSPPEFCKVLKGAGIPSRVFKDLDYFTRSCKK
jgi:hypothetical protein